MPSMIVSQKLIPALKKVMFSATAVLALMQCSEDESITPVVPDTTIAASSTKASALEISSLTITGSNTAFATLKDCKTCTYIVSGKEEIVDGKILGFKPGNIICLNKGVKYGNIEFINLDGSAENPIIIATIGKVAPSADAKQSTPADPY
jgi:hypothetical protein